MLINMKLNIKTALLALCFMTGLGTEATAKHSKKKNVVNLKLVEAYSQRVLGGQPGAPPPLDQHFIVIWEAATYPETFFWRGQNGGFLPCDMQKAHRISKKDAKKFPPNLEYNKELVTGDKIHKGDTLELTPLTRGKYKIPDDIPKTVKNTLFYKTNGSGWLLFPVKTISNKRDVPAP